jgi:hypothetical protein
MEQVGHGLDTTIFVIIKCKIIAYINIEKRE